MGAAGNVPIRPVRDLAALGAADGTGTAMPGVAAAADGIAYFADDETRPLTVRRLLDSAVQAFAEHGFEGTTTREICAGAGLSSAGLYVHFASKEDLLFEISMYGHRAALDALRGAIDESTAPPEMLRSAVHAFVLYHAEHHTLARVIQYEMRELSHDHFAQVAAVRREIDAVMQGCINKGQVSGHFDCVDVAGSALAIESLAIDLARWFRPSRGRSAPDDLASRYAEFALRIVGCRPHE